MDLYNGLYLGPVNYDSTVEVVTEALGIEFRQEMILSTDNSYCYVNYITPVLPESIGSLSPDFLANLDDMLSSMWNSTGELYYVQFDQIDVQKSEVSVYSSIDPVLCAEVEIPVVISGTEGYMSLAIGEFGEDYYNPDFLYEGFARASLIYQDGKWVVNDIYWF